MATIKFQNPEGIEPKFVEIQSNMLDQLALFAEGIGLTPTAISKADGRYTIFADSAEGAKVIEAAYDKKLRSWVFDDKTPAPEPEPAPEPTGKRSYVRYEYPAGIAGNAKAEKKYRREQRKLAAAAATPPAPADPLAVLVSPVARFLAEALIGMGATIAA